MTSDRLKPLGSALTLLAAIVAGCLAMVTGILFFGAWFLATCIAVVSLLAAVFFVTTAYSVFFGAPFVPTDARNVDEMVRMAGIRPGERLADLGSGDGRILIAAAKAGAQADGWEISPYLWLWSRWKIARAGLADRARVHLGSYWGERFDKTDIVTLFLINTQMGRMQKKLLAEMPVGGRVVSYAFKFPGWPLETKNGRGVYVYRKTAR
jgi:hypothetical protein